jgi:hypothetical protein
MLELPKTSKIFCPVGSKTSSRFHCSPSTKIWMPPSPAEAFDLEDDLGLAQLFGPRLLARPRDPAIASAADGQGVQEAFHHRVSCRVVTTERRFMSLEAGGPWAQDGLRRRQRAPTPCERHRSAPSGRVGQTGRKRGREGVFADHTARVRDLRHLEPPQRQFDRETAHAYVGLAMAAVPPDRRVEVPFPGKPPWVQEKNKFTRTRPWRSRWDQEGAEFIASDSEWCDRFSARLIALLADVDYLTASGTALELASNDALAGARARVGGRGPGARAGGPERDAPGSDPSALTKGLPRGKVPDRCGKHGYITRNRDA